MVKEECLLIALRGIANNQPYLMGTSPSDIAVKAMRDYEVLCAAETTVRNGDFMDEYGCCKVCNGEIPYGHFNHCDIYKLETRIHEFESEITAALETAGKYTVHVREGGGPEKLAASLAVTVAKMASELETEQK
jgi:hypothetical protein